MSGEFLSPFGPEEIKRTEAEQQKEAILLPEIKDTFEPLLDKGRLLVVVDLDGTIVPYRANPRDCIVDPVAHDALKELAGAGATVATVTGRSGVSADQLLQMPEAVIVGTNGAEIYEQGKTSLIPELPPHVPRINETMARIREEFLTAINPDKVEISEKRDLEEIHTKEGLIVFERKGMTEEGPEGIAQSYNFNSYDREDSGHLQAAIKYLRELYEKYMPEDLQNVISFQEGGRGVGLTPLAESPKWRSVAKLIRKEAEKVGEETLGAVIYIGDTDADARAIRMMRLVNQLTRLDAKGAVVVNIESTPPEWRRQQEKAVAMATLKLREIAENTQALQLLANLLKEKNLEKKRGQDVG